MTFSNYKKLDGITSLKSHFYPCNANILQLHFGPVLNLCFTKRYARERKLIGKSLGLRDGGRGKQSKHRFIKEIVICPTSHTTPPPPTPPKADSKRFDCLTNAIEHNLDRLLTEMSLSSHYTSLTLKEWILCLA